MRLYRSRTGSATAAVLLTAAGSLGVCQIVAPAWTRDAGLDVWNLRETGREAAAAAAETEELANTFDRLQRQIAANERVVDEVLAGRMPLTDAADYLAAVNRDRPGYLFSLRHMHRGCRSDRELYARQVIAMTARRTDTDPARVTAAVPRLENEFRAMR